MSSSTSMITYDLSGRDSSSVGCSPISKSGAGECDVGNTTSDMGVNCVQIVSLLIG